MVTCLTQDADPQADCHAPVCYTSSSLIKWTGADECCGWCRHARDGSVTSMFGTSAYQYNPRHSAAPSEVPRGIKLEPAEGTVATVPQADDLVKLGKRKAWAKFLAYEVSPRQAAYLS